LPGDAEPATDGGEAQALGPEGGSSFAAALGGLYRPATFGLLGHRRTPGPTKSGTAAAG
jgi:hypothetical protein